MLNCFTHVIKWAEKVTSKGDKLANDRDFRHQVWNESINLLNDPEFKAILAENELDRLSSQSDFIGNAREFFKKIIDEYKNDDELPYVLIAYSLMSMGFNLGVVKKIKENLMHD